MFKVVDGKLAKVYGEISPWAQGVANALPFVDENSEKDKRK